jgi:hypothetical protein
MRQVAAAIRDTERGQAKARGGDAGLAPRVARAGKIVARPVENLPGLRAGLLPEEQASLPFQVVQESLILFG